MAQTLSSAVPQVFDFLADPRNMPKWNSGVAEVDDHRIDPCEGARYRYRFPGRHRYHHLVCSAYRSPSLLGFRGERMWTPLGAQTVAYTFRVRSAESGSRLEVTVDVSVSLGMLLLLPVITLGWRRDLPEDLQRLRDQLDTLHARPVPPEPEPLADADEVRNPPVRETAARHAGGAGDAAL